MKSKYYRLVIILGALMTGANNVLAGSVTGQVGEIFQRTTLVNFNIKNDACAGYGYYSFDMSEPAAKNWYALILAAANTGAPLTVHYLNPCEYSSKPVYYLIQKY